MDNTKVPLRASGILQKESSFKAGVQAEELATKGLKALRAAKKHKGKK